VTTVVDDFIKCKTRHGEILIPGGDDLISRFLAEYGEWAHLEVVFLAENIHDNADILDIGAFLGTFGSGLSQVKRVKSVTFFEANPNIIPALKYNVAANCKANVSICNAIIAPADFDRQFGYQERGNLGSLSFATNPRSNTIAVATTARKITLRKALETNPDADLIKLDIEGMEYAVLREVTDILERSRTSFWIECNDNDQVFDVAELLLKSCYQLYYFAFPSYNPENYNRSKKVIFPMAYEAGLLASRRGATMSEHLSKLGCIGRIVANTEELREALHQTPRWIPERWHHLSPPEIVAVALRELQESSGQASAFRKAHDEALAHLERSSREAAEALHTSSLEKARLEAKLWHKVAELRAAAKRIEAVESAARQKVAAAENAIQEKAAAAECAAREKIIAADNAARANIVAAETAAREAESVAREVESVAREKVAAVEGALTASEARADFFETRLREALNNPGRNLRRHLRWRTSRFLLTFEPLLGESLSGRLHRRMQKNAPEAPLLPFARGVILVAPKVERPKPVLIKAKRPKSLRNMPTWLAYRILKTLSRQKWLLSENRLRKTLKSANKRAANLNRLAQLPHASASSAFEPSTAVAAVPQVLDALDSREAVSHAPQEIHIDGGLDSVVPKSLTVTQEVDGHPDSVHVEALAAPSEVKASPGGLRTEALAAPPKADEHPGGFRVDVLAGVRPLEDIVAEWISNAERQKMHRQDVLERLRQSLQKSSGAGAVVLSHDIYRKSVGGTQLCQLIEEAAFARKRVSYINLCPAQPLPLLSPEDNPTNFDYHITLDGECLGYVSADDLIHALKEEAHRGSSFGLVVHSLLGHSPEITAELYAASSAKQSFFWLHDYFSVCPNYNLMRNSIASCGGHRNGSPGCQICSHGEHRGAHLQRLTFLFSKVPFVLVAPSEVALGVWKGASDLPHAGTLIREHCTVTQNDSRPRDAAGGRSGPIRVAYLGMPAYPKGWQFFTEVVRMMGGSPDFEFHHFGSYEGWRTPKEISFTKVCMTAQDWDAMSRTVREKQIDVAMLCSPWPETYNFTTVEAIVGGALVVTLKRSGNIAAMTRKFDCGFVFDDEDALCHAFMDSSLATEIRRRRHQDSPTFQSSFENMSADLISLRGRSES
jgi:FkbM family methyltransferase